MRVRARAVNSVRVNMVAMGGNTKGGPEQDVLQVFMMMLGVRKLLWYLHCPGYESSFEAPSMIMREPW